MSTMPESIDWEVLVVDNNSRDQTRAVVEEFRARDPRRFRYVFEPRQGKSLALNAGIQEAQGDILAFTDDDLTVEPTWLQNLTASLDRGEWVGAGGRTLPERKFSPPRWLAVNGRYALGPLGMFDIGPEACEFREPPIGNNMAYRREMFEKYGGFRTDLGPRPGNEIRSEDTEFGQRLLSAGERLWYEPSAVVYHSTPDRRLEKNYFLSWWFDKARADVREHGIPADTRWYLAGVPLYLFRRLAVWTVRWIFTMNPSRRFANKISTWCIAGEIQECYRNAVSKKRNLRTHHKYNP